MTSRNQPKSTQRMSKRFPKGTKARGYFRALAQNGKWKVSGATWMIRDDILAPLGFCRGPQSSISAQNDHERFQGKHEIVIGIMCENERP